MKAPVHFSRRTFVAGSLGGLAMAATGRAAFAAAPPPVVVELFTSQGCSSCPPADDFMGELANRKGVVGLTLNVDYWDYLGWRDTLGSPAFSRRQRDYAQRRGDGRVYTPQMVIDGRRHEVGSRRAEVFDAIDAETRERARSGVAMHMTSDHGKLIIETAGAPTDRVRQDCSIWAVAVTPRVVVKIDRGENSGRDITYHNVVRRMVPVGMWNGDAVRLTLPAGDFMSADATACACLLQINDAGPILGAAMLTDPGA